MTSAPAIECLPEIATGRGTALEKHAAPQHTTHLTSQNQTEGGASDVYQSPGNRARSDLGLCGHQGNEPRLRPADLDGQPRALIPPPEGHAVQPQQPRTYRIRLYRDDYERLPSRQYVAVLDFSPGPGLRATEGQLDGLVQSLAYADGARGPKTLTYYLAVHDGQTDELRCHWPAKTWVED